MITKRQACLIAIEKFKAAEKREKVCESDVFRSSTLAVAMEYLGMLESPDIIEYVASRAGIMMSYVDYSNPPTIAILTFREFLSLLPEEIT